MNKIVLSLTNSVNYPYSLILLKNLSSKSLFNWKLFLFIVCSYEKSTESPIQEQNKLSQDVDNNFLRNTKFTWSFIRRKVTQWNRTPVDRATRRSFILQSSIKYKIYKTSSSAIQTNLMDKWIRINLETETVMSVTVI